MLLTGELPTIEDLNNLFSCADKQREELKDYINPIIKRLRHE